MPRVPATLTAVFSPSCKPTVSPRPLTSSRRHSTPHVVEPAVQTRFLQNSSCAIPRPFSDFLPPWASRQPAGLANHTSGAAANTKSCTKDQVSSRLRNLFGPFFSVTSLGKCCKGPFAPRPSTSPRTFSVITSSLGFEVKDVILPTTPCLHGLCRFPSGFLHQHFRGLSQRFLFHGS